MIDLVRNWTMDGVLDEHCRSFPDKVALVSGPARYTYIEVRQRVDRLAAALQVAQVKSGDRILWLGQNSHAVLETLLAAARLGAMFCPANWRQSAAELAALLDDLEPQVVIWQEEEIGAAVSSARTMARPSTSLWLQLDATGPGSYDHFLSSGESRFVPAAIDPAEPLLIIYTAAFDGRPNGAMLSQTAILSQNLILAPTADISNETVWLSTGPLFHLGTLMFTMATFHLGGKNVFIRRSDAKTICEAIHRERCTRSWIVGKTMDEIIELNVQGTYDLKSLRAPPYRPQWDAMVTTELPPTGVKSAGYGQTEVMGLATYPHYGLGGIGIFGRPSPLAQLNILDESGAEVPAGQAGEIVVRGPIVMNGYWRRPELNARRRRTGWHHTMDLGRREKDGTLTFIGPKTQMIKSGVENIYPAEVEACIRQHAAVADCAIIGVPDARWIQSVKAIIALKSGTRVSLQEIVDHCRDRIASYKKPTSIEYSETIPRNAGGGIDYGALDLKFGGGNYPGMDTKTF